MTKTTDDSTTPTPNQALEEHREHINRIDKTIVALLEQRMWFGLAVGDLKRTLQMPTKSESREAEVLERVKRAAAGALTPQSAERIFSTIIEETRSAEELAHG